jgi:hypothetical protein
LFYFKKSEQTREFFTLCNHIKENYKEYAREYGFNDSYVRNDHIWSVAVHQLGAVEIPTVLWFGISTDPLAKMTDDAVVVNGVKIQGQDVHVMDKFSLMTHALKELGCE